MTIEEEAKNLKFREVIVSLIVSAFALVAALFWRDAIQAFIEELVPQGQGLTYQFFVAILVTIIAVVAIYVVSQYLKTPKISEVIAKGNEKAKNMF